MISQFFILSPRGDTIILRNYLSNVPKVRSVWQASRLPLKECSKVIKLVDPLA